MRTAILVMAAAALAACGSPKEASEEAGAAKAPGATAPDDSATATSPSIDADAKAMFADLAGVWASPANCGDYMMQWVIDASSINLHEMHCSVDKVEKTANGVRTTGDCSVEGDDDGVADTYELIRESEGSLTIVQEGNGARYTGLTKCGATEL